MNKKDIVVGSVMVTLSILLLIYNEKNHALLETMISMGMVVLIAGCGFVVHGLLAEESLT